MPNTIMFVSPLQTQGTSSLEMDHTEQNRKTDVQYYTINLPFP